MSYFKTTIIEKKQEEANHGLFNSPISSLFSPSPTKQEGTRRTTGDKMQLVLGFSPSASDLSYFHEDCGPLPCFQGVIRDLVPMWGGSMGNMYHVISTCTYEKHQRAADSPCSGDLQWLSRWLSLRHSLEMLCLIIGRQRSQSGRMIHVSKDAASKRRAVSSIGKQLWPGGGGAPL